MTTTVKENSTENEFTFNTIKRWHQMPESEYTRHKNWMKLIHYKNCQK